MAAKIVDVRDSEEAKDLPSTKKVIHVEYVDPETGRSYGGEFTIQRLNLGDMRRVAIRRAELAGGMPVESLDENTQFMNAMSAHLEFAIIKSPEWWNPDVLFDGSVIVDVYEEVTRFEQSFRDAAKRRRAQDVEGRSPEPTEQQQASAP